MRRLAAVVAALACVLALGACGFGPGEGSSDVQMLVTRDFGARPLGDVPPAKATGSETVLRYLQRNFKVTTRYGGGFVQSIDGLAGGRKGGRPLDWFFYVNGIESSKGSADVKLHAGDRVWWDRHDWTGTQRVPAIVGSFPEPFLHGLNGKRWSVRVECAKHGDKKPCDAVSKKLGDQGILAAQALTGTEGGDQNLRVLVGPWAQIRDDRAANLIEDGPKASGVYARFSHDGRRLALLDPQGRTVRTVGPGGGLIAATRYEDQPPTWFVTGTDLAGVNAAIQALDEATLANRFALGVANDQGIPLPVEAEAGR